VSSSNSISFLGIFTIWCQRDPGPAYVDRQPILLNGVIPAGAVAGNRAATLRFEGIVDRACVGEGPIGLFHFGFTEADEFSGCGFRIGKRVVGLKR